MGKRATTKAAQPAQHERDAARRYLEHSHTAQTTRGDAARAANEHALAIDEEHARARDIALTGTARELGKLPPHLRRHQLEERRRAGINNEQAARIRHEYRSRPYEAPEESERHERPRHGRQSRAERVRGTVAPIASRGAGLLGTGYETVSDSSWGSLIGELFIGGVLLSIGYLLLTHSKGVSKLAEGATHVARAVVSPVIDPLNPKGVT